MSWFGKNPKQYDDIDTDAEAYPARTASDEYLEGLKFIADIYEKRAKGAKAIVVERANSIAAATNFERLNGDVAEIQRSGDLARRFGGIAEEIRGWIGDFKDRGYRPPHLPPLPPDPAKPESQGE